MPQCIPIRDLKNTTQISQMCQSAQEPIYITKNGYTDMVIMSAQTYDKIRFLSAYERLMEAEADIAEGRVSGAQASLQSVRAKYGL
ncbi:MAG: type II toxin-antitoxin system Phd/YefM family antitoxin [Eubacteriales bacterium]|nr:type II toxin-antitoxin system Phd/YefM family antitoxin [Eubacteriales bacterium]